MGKKTRKGFTLIELMIAVAIIGILSAIAMPRFGKLIAKSRESTTKGNLGAIRSALSIYYGDCEGTYPADNLASLIDQSKFLPAIPPAIYPPTDNSPGHEGTLVGVRTGHIPDTSNDVADNVSGWLYDNTGGGSNTYGRVVPNCTHSDAYGSPWTSY